MNWHELIKGQAEHAYRASEGLMQMVDDSELSWKPPSGENWMTVNQLLRHMTEACGFAFRGFVNNDWTPPADVNPEAMEPSTLLPAEKMPTVPSVAHAIEHLHEDQQIAYDLLAQCSEEDLNSKISVAPWNPEDKMVLGARLLQMVDHLSHHKCQLFYYLKQLGKPVNTFHLWA